MLCASVGWALEGESPRRHQSDIIVEEIPPDFQSGSFTLRITVRPDSGSGIDQVALYIKKIEHLEYSGPMEFTLSASHWNPAVFELPFHMANLDTAGMDYELNLGNGKYYLQHRKLYWISRADSAQRYPANPREWSRVRNRQPSKIDWDYNRRADSINAASNKPDSLKKANKKNPK